MGKCRVGEAYPLFAEKIQLAIHLGKTRLTPTLPGRNDLLNRR